MLTLGHGSDVGVVSKEADTLLPRGSYFFLWPWEFPSAHRHHNSALSEGYLPTSLPPAFVNCSGLIRAAFLPLS